MPIEDYIRRKKDQYFNTDYQGPLEYTGQQIGQLDRISLGTHEITPLGRYSEKKKIEAGYQPPFSNEGLSPILGVMETVDYLTAAPIRTGVNEVIKTAKQEESGPWDMFKSFAKGVKESYANPMTAPTGKDIAKELGITDKSFGDMLNKTREKTGIEFGGLATKTSPAGVSGFVGENVLDPTNLVPVGKAMMLGASAKGFKDAPRKFSALWDKKPRFEISDANVKFKEPKIKTIREGYSQKSMTFLDDLIEHPELFDNYPELRNLEVRFDRRYSGGGSFKFDNKNNPYIIIGSKNPTKPSLGKEEKNTLLHEIQHFIQDKEGFSRGGSINEFISSNRESPFNQYRRVAGEAEARDTEARMGLTEAERMRTQPLESTGLSLDELIVKGTDSKAPMMSEGPWSRYK